MIIRAATIEEFSDRIRYYGNHFWLMSDREKLIAFVDGFVTNEPDLTDEMYEKASMHDENGAWQMIFGVNTIPSYRRAADPVRNRHCPGTGTERTCADLQRPVNSVLCKVWISE